MNEWLTEASDELMTSDSVQIGPLNCDSRNRRKMVTTRATGLWFAVGHWLGITKQMVQSVNLLLEGLAGVASAIVCSPDADDMGTLGAGSEVGVGGESLLWQNGVPFNRWDRNSLATLCNERPSLLLAGGELTKREEGFH